MVTENLYTPDCIRTFSGRYIDVFDPNPDDILIEDIAHHLAVIPRFAGALTHNYTVGQHSIWVAQHLQESKDFRRWGLLHDAAEAYLTDLPKPIKCRMPDYECAEAVLSRVIWEKFMPGCPFIAIRSTVKQVDKRALEWEWKYLMLGAQNHTARPQDTKELFLQLFKQYSK